MELGIFKLDDDQYFSIKAISKSGLDLINQSPAHYYDRFILGRQPEPTKAMEFGRLLHQALLEPDKFKVKYTKTPKIDDFGNVLATNQDLKEHLTRLGVKFKNNAQKKELIDLVLQNDKDAIVWDVVLESFQKENENKIILTHEEYTMIEEMCEKVKNHPICKEGFVGTPELSIIWHNSEYDVLCKGKVDFIRDDGIVIDVKTAANASLKEFEKMIANHRYHVQAAFYLDGLNELTGKNFNTFVFVVIEKTPPYEIGVYYLQEAAIDKGREEYKKNLEVYATCLKTNNWYGYSREIQPVGLPSWAW
jgi:exodeoxyribonuclease VIII